MKLSDLLKTVKPLSVDLKGAAENTDPQIRSVHYRSQEVQPGGLFIAIAGHSADGHDFIEDAINRGAVAIVSQKQISGQTPCIRVRNTRKALADIAACFYGNPSERLTVIGITGTNGKTTTAYLVESILRHAGLAVGVIGTIDYRYAGKTFDNPITTPESLDLQRILNDMLRAGVSHVVMEASSHAIDLYRIRRCWFDVTVFINLSQDHLDFHGDMQSYWASKQRLFTEYLVDGPKSRHAVAVINCNSASGRELAKIVKVPVIKSGSEPDDTVQAQSVHCDRNGIAGEMVTPGGRFRFESRLVGAHNLENILCAAGVGAALNLSTADMKSGIEGLSAIPGRLESVANDAGRYVFVDYAHTPDALENVINSLKAVMKARIICVFGCGGDRDKEKRPLMGEIAARLCELAVITSDNPRTEDPLAIIHQILEGAQKARGRAYQPADLNDGFRHKGYVIEADRRQAIRLGIRVSKPGDTVLIAGKGHETYQILGTSTIAFDDREEAKKALSALNNTYRRRAQGSGALSPEPDALSRKIMNSGQSLTWTIAAILKASGGELLSGNKAKTFENVSIDSRTISPRDVFVAIVGEFHDGHTFARDVVQQGVSALIVNRHQVAQLPLSEWQARQIACVAVSDTTRALGDLAAFHRSRARVPVAAITGSNGKTTTRQMTAQVVAQKYRTLATIGNYNNQIGVPLTLLRLTPEYDRAVIELGTNRPGEIARLARICAPDIGVITNIGPAHLEGLGSLDGVMREKEQLIKHLEAGGKAVLNADDRRVYQMARRTDREVILYGLSKNAGIRASAVHEKTRGISFDLHLPHEHMAVNLSVPGHFMVLNALAAAAVGHLLELSAADIKTGLESFQPAWGRMNIFQTPNGIHIVDDTYNANPDSMKAALTTLKTLRANNRSLFVAGDMLELGARAEALHKQVGAWAAASGIDKLLITGEFADAVVAGARNADMSRTDIFTGTRDEILKTLKEWLKPGDWVLIKGSRGSRMDTVVEGLKAWAKIKPQA